MIFSALFTAPSYFLKGEPVGLFRYNLGPHSFGLEIGYRYAVVRGSDPVRDFNRPIGENTRQTHLDENEIDISQHNLFERAYPWLFPRGIGGFETNM